MVSEAYAQPVTVDSEAIFLAGALAVTEGFAVARQGVSTEVCELLQTETDRLMYLGDDRSRSMGGSRRALRLGVPRSFLEQALLSRPGLTTLHKTGAEIGDALGAREPNMAVVNRFVNQSSSGRVEAGMVYAHQDPPHIEGMVAVVSLAKGTLGMYEPRTKEGRVVKGARVAQSEVNRGDVALFPCADLCARVGISQLMHEVVNSSEADTRKSVAYYYSSRGPLTLKSLFDLVRQRASAG